MKEKEQFQYTIMAKHHLFDLHLRELVNNKDLVFLFVKRDFIALYKQTVLGPLWAVIQPLLTTIVFTVVFGNLAKLSIADTPDDNVVPSFLFYMIGNIFWTYFASTLQAVSNTFINNRNTMGKVYYPRMAAPIATALSHLISFGIQGFIFFILWLYCLLKGNTSIQITPMLLMIPLLVVQMVLLSVGVGIIISSLTTKYRDLTHIVGFGVQLWQYASPIAYGLELIPAQFRFLYLMNPAALLVTTFRRSLLGFGFFNLYFYGISWGITLLVFFLGLILFNRIERSFMDTI